MARSDIAILVYCCYCTATSPLRPQLTALRSRSVRRRLQRRAPRLPTVSAGGEGMSASTSRDTGTTGSRPEKRVRPPKLSLGVGSLRSTVSDSVTVETVASLVDITDDAEDWERRLSSPSLSSTSSSPVGDWLSIGSDSDFEANSDDLSKNLEILEKLGKHVHKNLRLRPLRSATASPDSPVSLTHFTGLIRSSRSAQNLSHSPESIADSAPSPALSIYYTPTTEFGESPLSAHYIGKDFPQNTGAQRGLNPDRSRSPAVNTFTTRRSPLPPRGIDADELFKRLASSRRPLLIDTRPPPSFLQSRIRHSLNIAIPSLIMRRCTKQGGGFASLDILRTYITTDKGKELWDGYMRRTGRWDGNIVVYDEEMNEKNQDNLQVLAWAMLVLLQPLLEKGSVEFLKGGISAARGHPSSHQYIISGERDLSAESRLDVRADDTSPRKGGLFQLDTQTASRSKAMPEIERPTSSPGPLVSSSNHNMLCDLSPSPSPSISTFPHHMKGRKGSAPSLGRIDTSSAERLVPKLTVRTVPVKSNTLSVAPSMSRHSSSSSLRPNSPRHLNLLYSNKTGSGLFPPSANSSSESLSPYIHQATSPAPRSPTTPMGFPPSPVTARPDLEQPPTTEEPLPVFSVSTILPNFLFLGPELTSHEHVRELQSLGIKRILNIAIECDDDQGLRLREKFERYTRIPMRDTVEEENVAHSVHEACEALGKTLSVYFSK